jgi:membrane protease subunit (stomatin/prohibitin family)
MELASVIQNDGPGKVLIWKHMNEDFRVNSQLVVNEAEEALFVKDGIIVQTFPGGKYTLKTANFPFLDTLMKKAVFGGNSPFTCKVYFVDKSHKMELFWGTPTPIQMRDAEFGFAVNVRASGSYSTQVFDAKKFFLKMVGNNVQFFTQEELNNSFRTAFVSKMKTKLATVMKEQKMTVLDMSSELENIAEQMTPSINEMLDEYGLRLVNFYIGDISIPENDPNYAIINKMYAEKGTLKVAGDEWGRLTAKELLKDLANNPGAGGAAAGVAGLGMGMAAGGVFGNMASQLFQPMNGQQQPVQPQAPISRFAPKPQAAETDTVVCSDCGEKNAKSSKFCNGCGKKLTVDKIKCPSCGAEMPETAKFCNECGTRRN